VLNTHFVSSIFGSGKRDFMSITVYTKPACVQCNATYRALDKEGIDYAVVDITEDAEARDYVMALGYLQAPVVVAGDDHWSGFRPDRIKTLSANAA
jgi:glutaredoxin-like protein NrdH